MSAKQKIGLVIALVAGSLLLLPGGASAQIVHLGNVIIDGSLCVGGDCVNGETFGFITEKLKENNLRITAVDTSNSASFPTRDWQIEFNSSTNGGGNYFMVRDCGNTATTGSTCGGTPQLTIEAAADNNSIYVESSGSQGGNVGFGTSNPAVDLHALSGNTPALRLEQDGSSGFTPQAWDVAGNEASFFIRDVTNGSTLPFRIEPGASSNVIYIENTDQIGVGTTNPRLNFRGIHIKGEGTSHQASLGLGDVPVAVGANCAANIEHNNGAVYITTRPCSGNELIQMYVGSNLRLEANTTGVDVTGDLTITGTCSAGGGACDFVLNPGYELESIDAHAALMWENSHLPAVGPTPDNNGKGQEIRINVFEKTAGILEELEKAHIYIEQLHKRLAEVEKRLAAQETGS